MEYEYIEPCKEKLKHGDGDAWIRMPKLHVNHMSLSVFSSVFWVCERLIPKEHPERSTCEEMNAQQPTPHTPSHTSRAEAECMYAVCISVSIIPTLSRGSFVLQRIRLKSPENAPNAPSAR